MTIVSSHALSRAAFIAFLERRANLRRARHLYSQVVAPCSLLKDAHRAGIIVTQHWTWSLQATAIRSPKSEHGFHDIGTQAPRHSELQWFFSCKFKEKLAFLSPKSLHHSKIKNLRNAYKDTSFRIGLQYELENNRTGTWFPSLTISFHFYDS